MMADPLSPPFSSCTPTSIQDDISPTTPPTQLAILDWFFPGFSMFAGVVQKYLHIDLNLYIPLLLLVGMLIVCWNYASQYLWEKVESHFMSVVDIRTDDEIYNILMAWVATQQFSQGARRFVVNTNLASRSWYVMREEEEEDDDDMGNDDNSVRSGRKKKKSLSYTPSFGSHYFWYRGHLLLFRRTANREQNSYMLVSEREEISISCFGRDPWVLKELLLEARQKYMERDQHKTQIYRGTTKPLSSDPTWQRCMSRATRPFSTVIINEKTKKELISDVTDYLNPATQRWYANRGIPYRRGYLLYGPPGTGKSSLSLALAGFFKMRIYIVSLSSVNANEEMLGNLFAALPRQCVVLLEDIDSAGLTHTREETTRSKKRRAEDSDSDSDDSDEPGRTSRGNSKTSKSGNGRLSLSGLLNILDGVASQEGRILIMTTNHIEKLDKALIRPGRVDMTIEFGLADEYMSANIFRNIFAYLEGDDEAQIEEYLALSPEDRKAALDKKEKDRVVHDAKIDELAKTFAAKIPSHEFSPAELQGHLMKHKHDPQRAIDTIEEFVEKTRKDHKEKEVKAAEAKRKAEQEKEEEAKTKEQAEQKIKKRVEEEFQKKFGEEIRKKIEAEMDKTKTADQPEKTAEESTESSVADTSSDVEGVLVDAKPQVRTTKAKSKEGHIRQDSGYATPASNEL
ncbi:BCS1 N terminal-domain-containing protein [Nemania sp. FL0031]|nr:BCS1 N terminal-domain-containing protein [Nemania sp. FL0031]